MGWYFRKSVQRGPVRATVSKSGIGVSAGVRGARVGIGPRGPYVAGGLGGLYFRKVLGGGGRKGTSPLAILAVAALAVTIVVPLAYLIARFLRLCVTIPWLGGTLATVLVGVGIATHTTPLVVVGAALALGTMGVLVNRMTQGASEPGGAGPGAGGGRVRGRSSRGADAAPSAVGGQADNARAAAAADAATRPDRMAASTAGLEIGSPGVRSGGGIMKAAWPALVLMLLVGLGTPAWADPEMTVAEWRTFVALVERTYGVQMARVASYQFAAGVTAHGHVWLGCLRPGRTVGQLAAWLRETAPAALTLRQALALDAEQHGCAPRAQEEIDAELKSSVGPPATGDPADLFIRDLLGRPR